MARVTPGSRSACPIAFGLDLFGDQWTLLIVRDLVFGADRTFQSFLQSPERIATNVLADRLDRLEAAGVVARVADHEDRRRSRFYLTERGLDLYPVLLEIIRWGGRHAPRSPATPAMVKRLFDTRAEMIAGLRMAARAAKRKARPKA
jgi:DNA-binding HxlR family transcriptional regulator